jgi:hypothetical protein
LTEIRLQGGQQKIFAGKFIPQAAGVFHIAGQRRAGLHRRPRPDLFHAVLDKPYSPAQLLEMVGALLARRQPDERPEHDAFGWPFHFGGFRLRSFLIQSTTWEGS